MTEAEQVEDLERALQPLLAIAVGALALAYVARRLWKLRLKRAIDEDGGIRLPEPGAIIERRRTRWKIQRIEVTRD